MILNEYVINMHESIYTSRHNIVDKNTSRHNIVRGNDYMTIM